METPPDIVIHTNTPESSPRSINNTDEIIDTDTLDSMSSNEFDSDDEAINNVAQEHIRTEVREGVHDEKTRLITILDKQIKILEVLDESQLVRIKINITMSWTDESDNISILPNGEIEPPSWIPVFHFPTTSPSIPPAVMEDKYSKKGSNIVCDRTIIVTLDTRLQHFYFPFDRQTIEFKIRCIAADKTEHHNTRQPRFESGVEMPRLTSNNDEWTGKFMRYSRRDNDIVVLACIERNPYFYLINIALMISIITAMTFLVLWVPHDDLSDRLSLDFTLVLASVALKWSISGYLPRISYLTYMDYYVLSNFGFLICCGIEHVVSSTLNDGEATLLDKVTLSVAGSLWLFIHLVLVILGSLGWLRPKWNEDVLKKMEVLEWNEISSKAGVVTSKLLAR